MSDAERKLAAARTRLILDKPFLGALVLRLPLLEAEANWCPTSATDARSLYFNREYIDGLNLSQVQFVLAHEALHCGLSHFARREHRDRRRWDVACDHAVNQLLLDDALESPPGALFDQQFAGMTAEEIYPCIDNDDDQQSMDQHLYDDSPSHDAHDDSQSQASAEAPANGRDNTGSESAETSQQSDLQPPPSPLKESERDRLQTQWQQHLASAAQQAMQAGKLSASAARLINRLLQPTLPWRALLARHLGSTARVDYNYARPSQRREGDAILPSLSTPQINLVVAIDTSGSIKQAELDAFVSEINAIKATMNARITLLACDDALDPDGPWTFESWQALQLPGRLHGGGRTDFCPVFDWLGRDGPQSDLLIYFTDARGRFPSSPPAIPTHWLVKGNAPVPWGQRIQLN